MMWFDPSQDESRWSDAAQHLCRVDPVLRRVIRRVGPCGMSPRRDYFVALCRSIFAQQLNIRVAQVLFDRFRGLFPGRRLTPRRALEILGDDQATRGCGLSRQKSAYLRDLAAHFVDNRIPTKRLSRMSDEQVIAALIGVKGIGRWTAEMFLMFVLNRPDVLPVDDLGLREGVREAFKLAQRPTAAELTALGEKWRPYRSVATWYIWRRNSSAPITASPARSAKSRSDRDATIPRSRPAGRKS